MIRLIICEIMIDWMHNIERPFAQGTHSAQQMNKNKRNMRQINTMQLILIAILLFTTTTTTTYNHKTHTNNDNNNDHDKQVIIITKTLRQQTSKLNNNNKYNLKPNK